MRKFYVEARMVSAFDRLIAEFCSDGYADCREGVLLDSALCYIGKNALAMYEVAETTNSSGYEVQFAQCEEDNVLVESEWYEFITKYDEEYGEV